MPNEPKQVSALPVIEPEKKADAGLLKRLWADVGDLINGFVTRFVTPQDIVDMATELPASKLTGEIDPARLPVLPIGEIKVISDGDIADLTSGQQSAVKKGVVVLTTDGRRWVYTGSGSKLDEANYVELADVTPDWSVIANKPVTFPPSAHDHAHSATVAYAAGIATDASAIPWDAELKIALAGDLTLDAPTNPRTPNRITYLFAADGTDRTLTLHAAIKIPTGFTFNGLIPANTTRLLTLRYRGTGWVVSENLNFA